uniref:Uncharacterized protein n=1 Tax=Dulem virus 248 TaxID=3145725 RepID=A0AAU8B965_9VIRU
MRELNFDVEKSYEQRRLHKLCGCRYPSEKPFCYEGSISPVSTSDPEIENFLKELSKQRFGCDRISPELSRRTDLSPAVINFVRDVLFKELPSNNASFIPDALTEDDEFVLSMFDDRRYTSFADRMELRNRIDKYIKEHSNDNK